MEMTLEIDLDADDFENIDEMNYQRTFILEDLAIFLKHNPDAKEWKYMMGNKVVAKMRAE
jgi:hypothetical protein